MWKYFETLGSSAQARMRREEKYRGCQGEGGAQADKWLLRLTSL